MTLIPSRRRWGDKQFQTISEVLKKTFKYKSVRYSIDYITDDCARQIGREMYQLDNERDYSDLQCKVKYTVREKSKNSMVVEKEYKFTRVKIAGIPLNIANDYKEVWHFIKDRRKLRLNHIERVAL